MLGVAFSDLGCIVFQAQVHNVLSVILLLYFFFLMIIVLTFE